MLFPHTKSKRVALRAAGAEDATLAYEILFRLGAPGLPLLDDYVKTFGDRLSACFLVESTETGEVVGLSTLTSLTAAGHLRMDVRLASDTAVEFAAETHALTANFAFAMWRTRKIYVHLNSPDTSPVGFGEAYDPLFRHETVLPEHTYFHGRLWDVHVLAIHRADWDTLGVELVQKLV
ncbi:hypothetical protein ACH4SP_21025 [Streptomyces sp. NPDC021093]|uniref:hypothetical protein n=1 Tax=Streptomyces sp. NPDC021093 TaxID=3365112 RepID=UPI0037A02204